MGLLDALAPDERQQMGYGLLSQLGSALMAAGSPSAQGQRGAILGQGFGRASMYPQAYARDALLGRMTQMQLAEMQRKQQADEEWRQRYAPQPIGPQMAMAGADRPGPTMAAASQIGQEGNPLLASIPPALRPLMADPTTGRQIATQLALREDKPPAVNEFFDEQGRPYKAQYTPGKGWIRIGGSRTDTLSPEAEAQKARIAAAGKPEVAVKVDNKMGESLAKPIGEIAQTTREQALGAVETVDTIERIRDAMDKANLGPTATFRQGADRFMHLLGVGGKTTEERLANTRAVMKGLAELSLSGRKALKGQGQVSDFEGKLLEKAASGDIDSLTVPELTTLLDVSERIARKQYGLHEDTLKTINDNPDYKGLAPFYRVPALPEARKRQTAPAPAGSPANPYSSMSDQQILDMLRKQGLMK